MKKDFGMPYSEKAIGIDAQDFASLFCGSKVYLTRAERVHGTPMAKSRFWLRLETVLAAMGKKPSEISDIEYKSWARYLDRVEVFKKLLPPEPKPPVSARPRELSASAIENLMRDPYIIFAKHILKLKPLDELHLELGAAEFGNIMHAVLEKFNAKYPSSFPKNAREEMLILGEEYFAEHKATGAKLAFWRPNLERMVDWVVAHEAPYRDSVAKIYSEVQGGYTFKAPAGEFKVTARADRVDVLKDGQVNVIDYKTGAAKKLKEVRAGYAPQLPIEGIIASKGGFENLPAASVEALMYWRLGVEESSIAEDVQEILEHNEQCIKELISIFDFETTPYISRPKAAIAPKYSDYEHLSRIKEWSVIEENFDD
jgi:ATP-dependent helicase/nuclease subunit B